MTAKKRCRIALIGAGGRSNSYAMYYANDPEMEIVALADPDRGNREATIAKSEISAGARQYDDWREMLARHKNLDGAVITTPNHLHAEQAEACLERGMPIVLEKPLAHTLEDCRRILLAERRHKGRILVGFVLRSAPFYVKINEIIRSGVIGEVTAIEADETVGWLVTSLFMRGPWRRFTATSGGALLEKCCHDMDLLNWMLESRPVSLNSYGGRRIFNSNPALPERCADCGVHADCPYYVETARKTDGDKTDKTLHTFLKDADLCVYNSAKDIADVQSVNLEYESGAVANFLFHLNSRGKRAGRNIHAIGKKGRVWGNIDELAVHVSENRHNFTLPDKEEVIPIHMDGSGHGGGDRRHALEFKRMLLEPDYRPSKTAYDAYVSAVTCIAADVSRCQRRRIDLRYDPSGLIEMAPSP
jgi:predicted dehydrogenase